MALKPRLTPRAQELLNELVDASKTWGWQEDQGNGASVSSSEAAFKTAVGDMTDYLIKQQVTIRKLRHRQRKLKSSVY